MREASSVLFVGRSAVEPVLLSGPPSRIAGRVVMRNPNTSSLVLRHAAVTDLSGQLANMPAQHSFAPIVLRAAEERTVELAIALDPSTPPGEYQVEVDVNGHVRPAVLNVVETVAVRVEPTKLVVTSEQDQPRKAQVVVSNEGNVPLTIGDIGEVDLRDDVAPVHDLSGVTGSLIENGPDNRDDLVALLLAFVPPRGPVVGRLDVRMPGDPVHIEPGQTEKIELEIKVPQDLDPRGRYRGRAAILTADLDFVLIPSMSRAPAAEPVPADEPASAARIRRPAGSPNKRRK